MSIPVTLSDKVHAGFSEAAGSLYLGDEFLELSIQVSVLGMIKQKPLTIKMAPEALHSVRLKRGMFSDTILIRPWKPALLDAVPGNHEGEVALQIKRRYRGEAEILIEEIDYWMRRAETA